MAETEKGVIIVAYKEIRRNQRFLVLKRTKNWEGWELPKGHLEKDDHEETVEIELEEEAGIKPEQIQSIESLESHVEWTYSRENQDYKKEYRKFVVKLDDDASVDTSKNPDEEHETGFFLNYQDAESLLEYDNNKDLLEEAKEHIEKEQ